MTLLLCIIATVVGGLLSIIGWLLYDFMKYKKRNSSSYLY